MATHRVMLLTKRGCIPCRCVKEAIAAAGLLDIEIVTKDLAVEQEWEEWKALREQYGFTLSPVLIAGNEIFCGVMSISNRLKIEV